MNCIEYLYKKLIIHIILIALIVKHILLGDGSNKQKKHDEEPKEPHFNI